MTYGKRAMNFMMSGVFFVLVGAYASRPILNVTDQIGEVMAVLPWQYWFVSGTILLALRLWWSERWMCWYDEAIRPYQKRISQMMTGWGAWAFLNWWVDNPLYLLVIAHKGLVAGGIIMTVFTAAWNTAYVLFHEYHKKRGVDWLGFDGIESMRHDLECRLNRSQRPGSHGMMTLFLFIPKGFLRLALWMLKKGDGFAFIALTIWTDSFVTLAYVRRGRSGKITGRDWGLFLLSTVISNAYWSIRSYGIVMIFLYLVHRV